jgi:carbonic anhydrase
VGSGFRHYSNIVPQYPYERPAPGRLVLAGDPILVMAIGGGTAWGAAVVRWQRDGVRPGAAVDSRVEVDSRVDAPVREYARAVHVRRGRPSCTAGTVRAFHRRRSPSVVARNAARPRPFSLHEVNMPSKKLAPLALLTLLALLVLPLRTLALDSRVAAEQDAILEELLEGNEAYAHGVTVSRSQISADLRRSTDLYGQKPKAIVLSCADSRVPVEHVFRQGVGDLFVVRLAGNVPMKLGGTIASVEYAIEHIGTPKVLVVLGHAKCGAVKSTIEVREGGEAAFAALTPELQALVAEIAPAVEEAEGHPTPDLLSAAIHENAELAAKHLVARSEVVRHAVESGEVRIVIGYYHLDTGAVDFAEYRP